MTQNKNENHSLHEGIARSRHQGNANKRQSGIAIGPILFVLALIGVVAAFMGRSSGGITSGTITADRLAPDIRSQANLIRQKIVECQMMRGSYPTHTSTGTLVSALTCPGDPAGQDNLWTGIRPVTMPPVPTGFNEWFYVNGGATGGRCIRIEPTVAAAADPGVRQGIGLAMRNFSALESIYNANSTLQRIIIWVTPPSGTADTNCAVGS